MAGYLAVVLSEESVAKLKDAFPPVHPVVHCHHMTVAWRPSEQVLEEYEHLLGKEFDLCVYGYATDDKGQAVRVVPPFNLAVENNHPHITLSCAEGVGAEYSNELLERNFSRFGRLGLKFRGTLEFVLL